MSENKHWIMKSTEDKKYIWLECPVCGNQDHEIQNYLNKPWRGLRRYCCDCGERLTDD